MARWYGQRQPSTGVGIGKLYHANAVFAGGETEMPVVLAPAGTVPLGSVLKASIEYNTLNVVTSVVPQRKTDGSLVVTLFTPDGAIAGTIPVNASVEF